MRMLRVAICGAGGLGSSHADNFQQIPETEVTLVYDVVGGAASALAEAVGAEATTRESDLYADEIDVVCVTTPTPFHSQYAVAAAEAGKHVFCEKPLARTAEQGRQALEAVEKAGVTMMVGHVLRFFPEYVRARELVHSGAVGEVGMVRTTRINTLPGSEHGWFANYEMSGGVTLDMVIHDLDWLLWTFGPAERVYAVGVPDHMPPLDYSLTTIRFESGVIAHVEGSWADLGIFRTDFEIAGSGGLIKHDSTQMATLTMQTRGAQEGLAEVQVPESPAYKSPYLLEDEHFVRCLLEGEQPEITPQDAQASLELALAACESIEAGGKVVEL
jgi:UDP-N-acetylglucosamine 3-dehydrogenase